MTDGAVVLVSHSGTKAAEFGFKGEYKRLRVPKPSQQTLSRVHYSVYEHNII